jgi:hypothetical protein
LTSAFAGVAAFLAGAGFGCCSSCLTSSLDPLFGVAAAFFAGAGFASGFAFDLGVALAAGASFAGLFFPASFSPPLAAAEALALSSGLPYLAIFSL